MFDLRLHLSQSITSFCQFSYKRCIIHLNLGCSPSLISASIKCQNGKLKEGTRYEVFRRSFSADGDHENEGFITFTTKDDGIPTRS